MLTDLLGICLLWAIGVKIFTFTNDKNAYKKTSIGNAMESFRGGDEGAVVRIDKEQFGHVFGQTTRRGYELEAYDGDWQPRIGCASCSCIFEYDVPSRPRKRAPNKTDLEIVLIALWQFMIS
jgi:hypothetical protein